MKRKHADSDYKQEEAEKRRDELLSGLLKMPPSPRPTRKRDESKKPKKKPPARASAR